MSSPSHRKAGAIVGGVIGGVAAVFAVISITALVQRRRRRARPRSILTFSTDFREAGPEPIVTPFDPYSYEAAQGSRILAEQQPLVTEEPEAEMFALHRLSDSIFNTTHGISTPTTKDTCSGWLIGQGNCAVARRGSQFPAVPRSRSLVIKFRVHVFSGCRPRVPRSPIRSRAEFSETTL